MDKLLKIVLMLSAVDNMSNQVGNAVKKSASAMQKFQTEFAKGAMQFEIGKGIVSSLGAATDAYGDLEAASLRAKTTMMGPGGAYDEKQYNALVANAKRISGAYTGASKDYMDMQRVMMQNRISPQDILGGIGESAAKLAVYFDMAPDAVSEFAAHMKNDVGVANKQMDGVMDLVARVHDLGVGKTGEEAVNEMNEFFSKAGLGMQSLHSTGLEAAKTVGLLGTIFMSKGLSGSTVGTNFRRIFDGMRDFTKLKKANEIAGLFHKHMDFFDKNGKFLGFENMITQLGKLQGMKPNVIAAILKPFSGKQGLSTDFLEVMATDGVSKYGEFKAAYDKKANFLLKVAQLMKGQQMQEKVLASNLTNAKSSIGATISGPYKAILGVLNNVILAIAKFIDLHPALAKFAGTFVAIAGGAMMLMGVVTMIKAVVSVMRILNITMAMNPIFIWIAAFAVVAALIIEYWTPITDFFSGMWNGLKKIFSTFWNWLKNSIFIYFFPPLLIFKYWGTVKAFFSGLWDLVKSIFIFALKGIAFLFLNFTPVGLIYNNWDKIKAFFTTLWEDVKVIFSAVFKWFWSWAGSWITAGKKIVDSIIDGIMSRIHKLTDKMHEVAQKIRNFFPFSPAKEGPLRDIHKVRLIETIAESMNASPMIQQIEKITSKVRNAIALSPQFALAGAPANNAGGNYSRGASQINFNFKIDNSGGNADGIIKQLKKFAPELCKLIDNEREKQERIKF